MLNKILKIILLLVVITLASCGGDSSSGSGDGLSLTGSGGSPATRGDDSSPTESDDPSSDESDQEISGYENSPFGFHTALVSKAGYNNNGYYDAQNIGVRWDRPSLYALWINIQPDINDPDYHWDEYDSLYGNIPADIKILANIAPQGNIDEGYTLPDSYIPVDEAKYISFVKATVERYDGDSIDDMPNLQNPIKYWQVGNEPQMFQITDFAYLQQITYLAIKEACSDCKVLIGGATGFPDDFESNFVEYSQILDDLNGQYVDIFDFHWYGYADGDYRESKDAYNLIISGLNEYGFGNIPIWITEMGSHSGTLNQQPDAGPDQTEAQQAGDYLKRFIFPLSFGVEKIFPAFGLIEGFHQIDGYFDRTGLIYDGEFSDDMGLGVKKLGYYSYKLMTEKLEGSDWGNILTIRESGNVYIYKFIKDNNHVYVAWWDYFDEDDGSSSKTITFSVDFFGEALITEAVPNAESGADLNENDYPSFFVTTKTSIINKLVTLTLGENPVFVEISN